MSRYLLDTNHLSAYLDREQPLKGRTDSAQTRVDRFGICLPVLCEYHAGIRLGRKYERNLARLQHALRRLWPVDEDTAAVFAEVFGEARTKGRAMSQFDLLIAAIARQYELTLLSSDEDFRAVTGVRVENWL